jgi:hypothetical protein
LSRVPFTGLFLIGILGLSCVSTTSIFNQQQQQNQALAQQYIPTIKYRNLIIDLGNGVKTNAQLTLSTKTKPNNCNGEGLRYGIVKQRHKKSTRNSKATAG